MYQNSFHFLATSDSEIMAFWAYLHFTQCAKRAGAGVEASKCQCVRAFEATLHREEFSPQAKLK